MILLYITIGLGIIYSILILYYRFGWKQIRSFSPGVTTPAIKISVIIAARNEEENIGKLLSSLEVQSYPKDLFEVIVVDDNSTLCDAYCRPDYAGAGRHFVILLCLSQSSEHSARGGYKLH